MKRILIPTDFSDSSNAAIDMAIVIGKRSSAEIHFVHLMSMPFDWIKLIEPNQKKMYPDVTVKVKDANIKLDALVERAEKEGLKAKKFILYNEDYSSLIVHQKSNECDFIIMGSHGIKGITEWLIGSNAQKIVRNSTVPVLVVKADKGKSITQDIILASDFGPETFNAFKQVLSFAKSLDLKIQLVYINTPSNFTDTETIEKMMKRFVKEGDEIIKNATIYNCYDFEEGLLKFAKDSDHIIAMLTHGSKGSITDGVINHISNPVLSVPA
jgi:nucleotide-binding universal stress UspA family protein